MIELINFKFAQNWLPKLLKLMMDKRAERSKEIESIADVFDDPIELSKYYVEPFCQQFNPANYDDEDRTLVKEGIFKRIESFLGGGYLSSGKHLFVLEALKR